MGEFLNKNVFIAFILGAIASAVVKYNVNQSTDNKLAYKTESVPEYIVPQSTKILASAESGDEVSKPELASANNSAPHLNDVEQLKLPVEKSRAHHGNVDIPKELSFENCIAEFFDTKHDKGKGSQLTDEEIEQIYPEPFSSFIKANEHGSRNSAYDFHDEMANADNASEIETHISDYYYLHELGKQVQLQQVTCKSNVCELLVTFDESGSEVSQTVFLGSATQPWWNTSSYSISYVMNEDDQVVGEIYRVELSDSADEP